MSAEVRFKFCFFTMRLFLVLSEKMVYNSRRDICIDPSVPLCGY